MQKEEINTHTHTCTHYSTPLTSRTDINDAVAADDAANTAAASDEGCESDGVNGDKGERVGEGDLRLMDTVVDAGAECEDAVDVV